MKPGDVLLFHGSSLDAGIVEMYRSGLSTREVGKRLGVSHAHVRRRLIRGGVERRRAAPPRRVGDDEVLALYEAGLTQREIAEQLGIGQASVSRRLITRGIRGRRDGVPSDTRMITDRGYVMVKDSSYFGTNWGGWVYEHILVWETAFGLPPPDHAVHHLNGDKADNRLENLVLLSKRVHAQIRNGERWARRKGYV